MQRSSGWTTGSKIMATSAGFVLVTGLLCFSLSQSNVTLLFFTGIILTLLTMNSGLHMSTYRPIIFTILGILCIIVGPMLVCRLVLNAYDRRLSTDQRHFVRLSWHVKKWEALTSWFRRKWFQAVQIIIRARIGVPSWPLSIWSVLPGRFCRLVPIIEGMYFSRL